MVSGSPLCSPAPPYPAPATQSPSLVQTTPGDPSASARRRRSHPFFVYFLCQPACPMMLAPAHYHAGTACWPCRQRKVKCDNKAPCENCVKREHSALCSYKPNRSATGKSGSFSDTNSQTNVKKRPHSPDEPVSRSQSHEGRESISAYGV